MAQPLCKTLWHLLSKLITQLSFDKAILLIIYPRETRIYIHTKNFTLMVISYVYIIIKNWKLSKCPLMDEWINKAWHIHAMEYHSENKRNKICIQPTLDIFQNHYVNEIKWS